MVLGTDEHLGHVRAGSWAATWHSKWNEPSPSHRDQLLSMVERFKMMYEDLSQKMKWMESQIAAGAFQNMPSSTSLEVGSGKA